MIILRGPATASSIADNGIRNLVQQQFTQICDGAAYDYDLHGYMIVVEPGDTAAALEEESGCRIMRNLFDDIGTGEDEIRFGNPEFVPSFEWLEEHAGCYEMVFILNDDGFGIGIFIPKQQGIDDRLLAMCAEYATPATPVNEPISK